MTRLSRRVSLIVFGVVLLGALAIWETTASRQTIFFFSKPTEIAGALEQIMRSGQASTDFVASLTATVAGLALGATLGVLVGLTVLLVPLLRDPVRSFVAGLAALPVLAIAPMFLIWFGTDLSLKIALGTLLSALVVTSETLRFPSLIDPALMEMATTNRYGRAALVGKIILPYGVRAVLTRAPDAANAAFLGVFVGEFVASDRGIGYRILRSGSLYQVDHVWAAALLAVLLLVGLQVAIFAVRVYAVRATEALSIHPIVRRQRASAG